MRNGSSKLILTGNKCPCCSKCAVSSFEDGPFDAYFCDACDHVWYDSSEYETNQNVYENSEKYESYYVGKPPYLWYHRNALEYLAANVVKGRVLDFGCFDGFFTAKLVEAGFDAYGCDWNRKAIDFGRNAYSLGDRLSYDPDGQYDAIVALEVIEHFPDPNDFLAMVLPHLAPNGVLVLSCPNKNSIYRPKTDAPPHHFSRFSEKSLSELLIRHGMKIEIREREMSSFQLLRNFLGDSLRRDAPLLNEGAEPKLTSERIRRLKLFANSISNGASILLRPVDFVAHALGLSYLSQFVVARSNPTIVIDRIETN